MTLTLLNGSRRRPRKQEISTAGRAARNNVIFGLLLVLPQLAPATVRGQESAAQPCQSAEHRQFDFWIGDWEVKLADGTVAGNNRIEKILGGCSIAETWSGRSGSRGQSLNIYAGGRWHQSWVDNSGTLLLLDGGLEGNKMVLRGETPARDGGKVLQKITWEPLAEGRLRQHWQSSRDDGATWQDLFDGYYSRRP
jgi:hypothetical protein